MLDLFSFSLVSYWCMCMPACTRVCDNECKYNNCSWAVRGLAHTHPHTYTGVNQKQCFFIFACSLFELTFAARRKMGLALVLPSCSNFSQHLRYTLQLLYRIAYLEALIFYYPAIRSGIERASGWCVQK